jgi:hypothetical protein
MLISEEIINTIVIAIVTGLVAYALITLGLVKHDE